MSDLYPLRFREILRDYDFGGRWIAEVFEKPGLPTGHPLSETWEVCDRPGESGVVSNGALAGRSLHEILERDPMGVLGRAVIAVTGARFPLLIKILDATNPLGEQAHQDDTLAREQGLNDPGKTEAWYMLKTRAGASLHCGTRPGVSRDDLEEALVSGSIRDTMEELPAGAGDGFLLHAGTMHYSRGGVLFYEIMQNSDALILLDTLEHTRGTAARRAWAREVMRGVRLVAGRDCRVRPVTLPAGANHATFIFACTWFSLVRLDLTTPHEIPCTGEKFHVLTQIEGISIVAAGDHRERLGPGQTCLLPAGLGTVRVEPAGTCSLLQAYVPDLVQDIVRPLRAAGVQDPDIIALGGEAARNPLIDLVATTRSHPW